MYARVRPIDRIRATRHLSRVPTVSERELARLREMTPAEKLAVSELLWRQAWALKQASIARQRPDWTPEQIRTATRRALADARD
jgi:hypothetical protein